MNKQFDNYSIRLIKPADAEEYFEFISQNRKRIETYFPVTAKANSSLIATKAHIEERMKQAEEKKFLLFVIRDEIKNEFAGIIFLKDIEWNIPKAEVGFFTAEKYEGKGIISKSLNLLKDFSFNEYGINKLFMRIAPDNIRSKSVAERNGFTLEGTLRKDFKSFNGELIDVMYYGMLKEDYNLNK